MNNKFKGLYDTSKTTFITNHTHTRNQKRMYRIHKLEEKVHNQDLLIGSLQSQLEQKEKQLNDIKEELNTLIYRYNYEEDFYVEDIHLEEILNIIERNISDESSD